MHQSTSALLARAYIMQKQVLAFRCCFIFDIYSDYALFTVCVVYASLKLVKKVTIETLPISEFVRSFDRHMQRTQPQFCVRFVPEGHKIFNKRKSWYIEIHRICCHLFLGISRRFFPLTSWVMFRNKFRRGSTFFFIS